MTLEKVKKLSQGCPCEEVVNNEYCSFCGYLNTKFGWESRYCTNPKNDLTWRDKYACRHAKKAMHDYDKGDTNAFYRGNNQGGRRNG